MGVLGFLEYLLSFSLVINVSSGYSISGHAAINVWASSVALLVGMKRILEQNKKLLITKASFGFR